jgi:hypothetical protein
MPEAKIVEAKNYKNIYQKLQEIRELLSNANLKKSGQNSFNRYGYYELSDILPTLNRLMLENGVTSVLTYTPEMVTLSIINCEQPDDKINFTCPMSTAQLKGNHEVQNMGAVITYTRRYLYINAFEIVESDTLDSVHGKPGVVEDKKPVVATETADSPISSGLKNQIYMMIGKNEKYNQYPIPAKQFEEEIGITIENLTNEKGKELLTKMIQKAGEHKDEQV